MKLLAFILMCALSSVAHAAKPEVGEVPLPMDRYEHVDGSPVDLADYRGKPTIIYMGGSWCPPCREKGRPTIERLARTYGSKINVLFIDLDDNRARPSVLAESKSSPLKFIMPNLDVCPLGKCPTGTRDLGRFGYMYAIPSAVLLDEKGIVRKKVQMGEGVRTALEPGLIEVLGSR